MSLFSVFWSFCPSNFLTCFLLWVLHVSSSAVFSRLETCFHLFHLHRLASSVWFLSSSFLWSVSCILTFSFCFYFLLSFWLSRFSILWFCFCFVHTCKRKPISFFSSFLQLGGSATWPRRRIQQESFFFCFVVMSDVIPCSWWFSWWLSHQIRATKSYYCGDGPCAAACSICCFFSHLDLGPSPNFFMDCRSFPQLLQSFFLFFCVG